MKILILSPHIDDAFLSLGGFISKYSKSHCIEVVNVFSFDPWVLEDFDTNNKLKNIMTRKVEESKNTELSKIKVKYLDLPAGWKERGYPSWQSPIDKEKDSKLIKILKKYVRTVSTSYDVTLAPLAIGGHIDHKLVRLIASTVTSLEKIAFYEDLPYAFENKFLKYGVGFIKQKKLRSVTLKLGTSDLRKKEKLVNTYKSQLKKDFMDRIMSYTKRKGEVLWTQTKMLT